MVSSLSLLPLEKEITRRLDEAETGIKQAKTSLELIMTESSLQDTTSLIAQLEVDQKAMIPSNKKNSLSQRLQQYKRRSGQLEYQLDELKDELVVQGGSTTDKHQNDQFLLDFEEEADEEEMQSFLAGRDTNSDQGVRRRTTEALTRQSKSIDQSLKKGHDTSDLARSALGKLRGQRDQIMNIGSTVRELGVDLVRTEKLTKDLTMRKFLTIVVLYLIMCLLALAIILVLYYKIYVRAT